MTSYFWGPSVFDEAVDKATSELLPAGTDDIALSLEICDQIRSKSVQPRDAMRAIKRRLDHKNPNVQLLALGLTDVCIKNGGDHFLEQVASREFMDNLVSILKQPALNYEVKSKMLRLVQNWALAFESKPSLGYVPEVYRSLKNQGFNFPPPDTTAKAKALLATRTAPEWIDSDVCLRCRTPFTFTNRKHHCRNCGQVFDQQCSSRTAPLPHFGIAQEVRVCDSCWTSLKMDKTRAQSPELSRTKSTHSRSNSRKEPRRSRVGGDTADDDLQRAIALSLAEAQANANGYTDRPGYVPATRSEPPVAEYGEEDADLRAAIEASLRESQAPRASAPAPEEPVAARPTWAPQPAPPKISQYDLDPREEDAILSFNQTIEQASTGVPVGPQAADMYERASVLRPKLAMSLNDASKKEYMLTEMHDKLSEAVKLYDRLLTEQVERSTWRYQNSHAQQYGQPQYANNPSNTVNSLSNMGTEQPALSPQQPYSAPSAPQQYSAPQPYAPESYPAAPPAPQPAYPSAPPPMTYQTPNQYAPASSPPVSRSPELQRHGSMTAPVSILNPARPVSMYAPPPPQTPQQASVSSSYPPQPYQAATPAPQPYQSVTSPAPLSRANTYQAPVQDNTHQAPSRANTYQAPNAYQTPSQPQPYQNVAAPAPLPNLPSVPPSFPSAPQGFPQTQYGGVEKTEQQEAMLISFD
ncbi:Vacuolar protein sorting-associated protein 27 [Neurospora crassa OR74A] [Rhizoctonia solani]|uniref:Vacuolar protein sorting-associated protein 27 n=1 Tax=Rhizoctonia solani TaxID=456999 RepID=A0A0K6FZ48_9AGAM|nr:Vacuolar protein sorting-associated protein 27 [Neurospora crassa OR74A] [Rhizoctonia solani]